MKYSLTLLLAIFGLWSLVVAYEFAGVGAADIYLAQLFNSVVQRSETLDLTIIFFCTPSGDLVTTVAFVLMIRALFIGRSATTPNLASYLSFGLFVCLGVAATYVAYEAVDSYVLRASPANVLDVIRSPAILPEVEFRFDKRSEFPNSRACIYSFLFFFSLQWFRMRALTVFLVGIPVTASELMAANAWFSHVVAGYFLGWAVSLLFNVASVRHSYLFLEESAADYYERRLLKKLRNIMSSSWKSKGVRASQGRTFNTNPGEALALPAAMAEIAASQWGLQDPKLLRPPHKGRLYKIESGEETRAYKISRFGPERVGDMIRVLEIIQGLGARGNVHVPRIYPTIEGDALTLCNDKIVYMMEWVDGRPADISTIDDIRKIMQVLAHLHRDTEELLDGAATSYSEQVKLATDRMSEALNEAAGSGRKGPFRLTRRVAEDTELVDAFEEAARAEVIANLALLYASEDNAVPRLCYRHGDTHPMNYLIRDSGEVTLIDFDYLRLGLGYEDLSRPLGKFLRRMNWDVGLFQQLIAEYTAIRPLSRAEIVLLLSQLIFPWRATRLYRKAGSLRGRSNRISLLKENLQTRLTRPARLEFIEQVGRQYNCPLVSLSSHPKLGMLSDSGNSNV